MKTKEIKTVVIDTGGSGGIDRLKAKALSRAIVRFFEDEENRKACEEYIAEKHRTERSETA